MASKLLKIGLAVIGIIFGALQVGSSTKDFVEAVKETPEEKQTEQSDEESE